MLTLSGMSAQTTTGGFPEFTPGDRLRLVRRKVLHLSGPETARALGVEAGTYAAWEAGRNEAGITVAVAKRVEALTGKPGTAAFVLGVLPEPGPGLPRLDSNQKPPGLRHVVLGTLFPRALQAA